MRWLVLAAVSLPFAAGSLSAQGPGSFGAPIDKSLVEPHNGSDLYGSLRDVINYGAELFNKQADHAGCYRVYQGALISIRPYMAPAQRKRIDESIVRAEGLPYYSERAFELRRTLDEIRTKAAPAKTAPVVARPTIEPAKKDLLPTTPRVELPKITETPGVSPAAVELPKVPLSPTIAPKVELPKIEPPKVELPKVELPKIEPPKIELPPVNPPEREKKKIEPPKVESPKIELPKVVEKKPVAPLVELPKVEPPKIELPKIELPKVEPPSTQKPKVELPKVEGPGAQKPKPELPKVEPPKVEAPKVEPPKIDIPMIDPLPLPLPSPPPSKEIKDKKVQPAQAEVPQIDPLPPITPKKLDEPAKDLGEVAGKVLLDGKPLPSGFFITLVSVEAKKRRFSTIVQSEGAFQFTKALPLGTYRVAVEALPGDTEKAALIPMRYRDEATSGLTVQVTAGRVTPELRLTK